MCLQHVGLDPLETTLGYTFRDKKLLELALTHPSRAQEDGVSDDNQRLEFLGDAVLGLVLAEALFQSFPAEREGFLARGRSVLARGAFLAELARRLDLPVHLRVSEAERAQDGHQRDAALEDALEALIGALYLDSDYPITRDCLLRWYGDISSGLRRELNQDNPKGRLQEWVQAHGRPQPEYRIVAESGPDHDKTFRAAVHFDDDVQGQGEGRSKKEAEEAAARDALDSLEKNGPNR